MELNRKTRERLKAAGMPAGEEQLDSIKKKLVEIAQSFPDTPPTRRKELRQKLDAALTKRADAKSPNNSTAR